MRYWSSEVGMSDLQVAEEELSTPGSKLSLDDQTQWDTVGTGQQAPAGSPLTYYT